MSSPSKSRDLHSHHFNTTRWDHIHYRENDVIVTTSYKSGTTWMQNIIFTLDCQGKEKPKSLEHSYWIDLRVPPLEMLLPTIDNTPPDVRRQFKTHARLDALKYSSLPKYIFVGRDIRDQFMSLYNHYQKGNDVWYNILSSPGLVGEPIPRFSDKNYNECTFFEDWISKGWSSMDGESDGYPFWSAFDHARTWWEIRHLPNIMFIHYNDMLSDLPGSIRKIASFINHDIQEEYFDDLVKQNTFEEMKSKADENPVTQFLGTLFEGGAKTFINKGTNGRWKDVLTESQIQKFQEISQLKLSKECAAWMENGSSSGIDPKAI